MTELQLIMVKAPKPRTLPSLGSGSLHDEQQYCYEKGWKEGIAAFRKAQRLAVTGKTITDKSLPLDSDNWTSEQWIKAAKARTRVKFTTHTKYNQLQAKDKDGMLYITDLNILCVLNHGIGETVAENGIGIESSIHTHFLSLGSVERYTAADHRNFITCKVKNVKQATPS